jgi:hypothetical protein
MLPHRVGDRPVKLLVRHPFSCSPEAFWDLYWSPEYDQALDADSEVRRELVVQRDEAGVIYRRVKFIPNKDLPGPIAALIGTPKFTYEQDNWFDRSKSQIRWVVLPGFLQGKFDAAGTLTVKATPAGCELVVEGDFTVHVRFVGGQIEKAVVSQVEQSYERLAAATRTLLAKRA